MYASPFVTLAGLVSGLVNGIVFILTVLWLVTCIYLFRRAKRSLRAEVHRLTKPEDADSVERGRQAANNHDDDIVAHYARHPPNPTED